MKIQPMCWFVTRRSCSAMPMTTVMPRNPSA
jgi:hypothetical protein